MNCRIKSLHHRLLNIIVFIIILAFNDDTKAQEQAVRIAAVVNEDIISLFDIQSRIQLFLTTSGIEDTLEIRQRLLPQVMNALIDEKLKLQEARNQEIETTEEEISNAINIIEQNNGMNPGTFLPMLLESGVNGETFYNQVKADVAWLRVVREVLSRDINISESEVDLVLDRLKENQGKPEYLLAEIFLPVVLGARDRDVRELAEQLVKRAREGAAFPALAQQFSQSPTAAIGGDLGWTPSSELEIEIQNNIRTLRKGEISNPIRTLTGYTIIIFRDQRATAEPSPLMTAVTLSQIFLPTTGSNALSKDRLNQLSQAISTQVSGCNQMNNWADQIGGPGSGNVDLIRIGSLPEEIRDKVLGLSLGVVSPAIEITGARLFIMVCSKEEDDGLPSPNQVYAKLESDKLDTVSRQRLRDLRRQALIDIRL